MLSGGGTGGEDEGASGYPADWARRKQSGAHLPAWPPHARGAREKRLGLGSQRLRVGLLGRVAGI